MRSFSLRRLVCVLCGHHWTDVGNPTVIEPHESVKSMGPAIMQNQICLVCEAEQIRWVRHPFYPGGAAL